MIDVDNTSLNLLLSSNQMESDFDEHGREANYQERIIQ